MKRKFGREFFVEAGRRGGQSVTGAAKRRSKEHYSQMGKRSAAKRWPKRKS